MTTEIAWVNENRKVAKLTKPLRNRVIGSGVERVDELLANPGNWRIHPNAQQQALAGAIDEIGFIRSVTVNRVTGNVVDGHLRVALAMRSGVEEIPVEYVELTEEEEALALLSLDPVSAMAMADRDKFDDLLRQVQVSDERLSKFLADLEAGLPESEWDSKNRQYTGDVPEMELQPFEHYDYVVLLFDNALDWQRAIDLFGIGKARVVIDDRVTKFGLGRAIRGQRVLDMIDGNEYQGSNPLAEKT